MNYIIKGNLYGFLCEECTESISGVDILLYLPAQKDNVLAATVANAKETFRLVTKDEAAARKDLLVATAKTDEKGNFELSVGEKYGNTAFDIDFFCGTVPRFPPKGPKKDPVQFHITTFYPQWRTNELQETSIFKWQYAISAKWWCLIRGYYFDAWMICGHVYVAGTKTPIPNLKVTAWDADLLTDDNIGSDTTDANGHFRIDYTSIDFKQTFLSPWFNIESDPGAWTFKSGPDVYFKYEYKGAPIQGETAADRRDNVGYCLCVDLYLKDIVIEEPTIPASFTKMGNHFINEVVASGAPNVIALATGKTAASQAFFSCVDMVGVLTKKLNGQPMEYCFETVETAGAGGAELGAWTKVKAAQMCDAIIGSIYGDPDPITGNIPVVEYHIGAGSGAIDADGWIAVPQVAGFAPNVNGVLMSLNTGFLNGATVDLTGLVQGLSTTTKVPLQQNRFFKVRMKKRQAGNAATEVLAGVSNPTAMFNTIYKNVPQFGSWMPSTSAEFGVACLDVQELIGGGIDCTPITDGFHVNYTAANPNMGGVSLILYGPGGPYTVDNVAPTSSVAETFGTASGLSNAGGIVDVKTLKKCAYSVWLSVELKLTDGRTQHSDIHDWLSFCKQ